MVLTFEDTPLFDWLKKNRFYILAFVVVVVGIQAYREYMPGMVQGQQKASWALYQDIVAQFDPETNVSESLARGRQDDRIFPWLVYAIAQGSLDARNRSALEQVKPELDRLAGLEAEKAWKVPAEVDAVAIPSQLQQRVDEFLASTEQEVVNPAPTGSRVEVTVTDGAESTYSFTVGLFEEQAPVTAAAFLDAVEAGRFVDQSLTTLVNRQCSWTGMKPEEGENLPKESQFGIFHVSGALSTVIVPGVPGEQNPDIIQLLIEDNFSTDGTTTVFGQVVEGLDRLRELVNGATEGQNYVISATTLVE